MFQEQARKLKDGLIMPQKRIFAFFTLILIHKTTGKVYKIN